jgi:hypothetical protein
MLNSDVQKCMEEHRYKHAEPTLIICFFSSLLEWVMKLNPGLLQQSSIQQEEDSFHQ